MVQIKKFGKYEIVRKLGRSMTDVYLAFDPEMNRHVVLKLVETSRDEYTELVIEAERRGAGIQKQLHEADSRILEIYGFGEQNGCFFVVMEHCDGRNIAELLQTERRLNAKVAARYALEVLSQLDRLHSFVSDLDGHRRAVVHGDIKPSNIQLSSKGDVRLLDFGIAKVITYTHNLTHHNLGSPTYCSPERLAKAQVDPQSDLWALGVSLYEMVAGSPPYQAQSTRKLENLIQSRRPPRALPESCPRPLRAIISKALAGPIERRYASAAEFENDLLAFVEDRPTAAENERQPSWESNATVQKEPAEADPLRRVIGRVGQMAGRVTAMRIRVPKPSALRRDVKSAMWALSGGILFGLFVVMPLSYLYSFRVESRPLRNASGYAYRSTAEIIADWSLYKKLDRESSFLGSWSPVTSIAPQFRANLIAAADAVIDRYRISSDPLLSDFDWSKARQCLKYAQQMDPLDRGVHGKLALCEGYLNLIQNPALPKAQSSETGFQMAASDLPRSPDAHLALARLYIYAFHNAGKAMAQFNEAERCGFRPGPRELEQQADAYLYRGEWAVHQAQETVASKNIEERWLRRSADDLERARTLYEPIFGFSTVSDDLDRVYLARDAADQLRADLAAADEEAAKKAKAAKKQPRHKQVASVSSWQ